MLLRVIVIYINWMQIPGEFLDKVDIGSTISMSSPNLSDDTLFDLSENGPLPYTFTAYDLLTDELKWQTPFEDVVSGLDDVPPAVFDNKVVTTALEEAESEGDPKLYDHMIYAMDTETGEVLWKKDSKHEQVWPTTNLEHQ